MAGKNLSHVRLVDDLPINLFLLDEPLSKTGYVCELAENGLDALKKLDDGKFDFVFMNCEMKIMTGYTTIQETRKSSRHPELEIICTSATRNAPSRVNPCQRCETCNVGGFSRSLLPGKTFPLQYKIADTRF
ncbi:MAG: hypothetical protein A2017_21995 [Lentisphaerae bacterium GWF2_44_16]|nr:MAG: hypothetical protein A2017_21995 [Lentisphaerae bacterium GWF2_44_16]